MTKIFSIISLATIAQPLSIVVPMFKLDSINNVSVIKIRLNESIINFNHIKKTYKLVPTFEPANATNKNLIWESTNSSIASVDEKGLVTAKGVGDANILCTSVDNPNIKASCYVNVDKNNIQVKKITFSQNTLSFKHLGKKSLLSYTIEPANATNKNLIWESINPSIASVDKKGLVTAISEGTTTITCSSAENPNIFAKCSVIISTTPIKPIKVNYIGIDPIHLNIKTGDAIKLDARIYPKNATNKKVIWKSLNPAIASIDDDGVVTGVKDGNTRIIVESTDGSRVSNYTDVNVSDSFATINWYTNKINAPTYGFNNKSLWDVAKTAETIEFNKDNSTDGAFCGKTQNDKIYAKFASNKLIIWSPYKISFIDELDEYKHYISIFDDCVGLQTIDFSNTDFSRKTNFEHMFYNCHKLSSLDLSNFDTRNATSMYQMFYYCEKLTTIFASDKFIAKYPIILQNMFKNNYNLIGGNGTKYSDKHICYDYARIDTANTPGYFTLKINNFSKTDYTVHYEGNSGDCYDITSDKFVKGPGTYFKEPRAIDLETTCRSTRLRMLLQQYSFDVVVPPKTKNLAVKVTIPLQMNAHLNGHFFGTKFEAAIHLFNQGSDEANQFEPIPISGVSFNFPEGSDTKKFECSNTPIGSWRKYDETWSDVNLFTTYNLSNRTSKTQIQKCYFSLSLYIRGKVDSKNGNTGAELKLQDTIKFDINY